MRVRELALGLGVALGLSVAPAAEMGAEVVEDAMAWSAGDTEALMTNAFRNFFGFSYVQRIDLKIEMASGRALNRTLDVVHSREDGASRWWIYYRAPEFLRGTAILRIGRDNRDDEHFLYSPEAKRVRRISGAHRADKMAGTDFSYEDLDIKDPSEFTLTRLGSDEFRGVGCILVEGLPLFESMYERIEWCIDPGRQLILRMRGYGANDVLVKTLEADLDSVSTIQGVEVAERMTMRDERSGTQTHFDIREVRVDPKLPRDLFSSATLERRRHTPHLKD